MSLAAALMLLTTGCAEKADNAQAAADACRAIDGWSAEKRAEWLRPAVSFPDDSAAEEAAAVIGPHPGGPLCEPIAVQVQFWEATSTAAGTDFRSVLRIRLATDGSRPQTIGFPAGLSPEERDDCTGLLMAAYPGAPLARAELPTTASRLTSASTTEDTTFGTTRVAAQRLLPPTTACSTAAEPTPNPWGSDHP
jgi:hypothetical protein